MAFLTQEQLDALAQFDTPTICNAIEGFGVRGRTEGFTRPELRMRAAMSDKPMVGYARTGVISARQPATPAHSAVMEAYYRQYEDFDLPMVAAIQDLDRVPVGSFWGDVQATVHRALGCIGVITDGGVRDIEEVKRVLPVLQGGADLPRLHPHGRGRHSGGHLRHDGPPRRPDPCGCPRRHRHPPGDRRAAGRGLRPGHGRRGSFEGALSSRYRPG